VLPLAPMSARMMPKSLTETATSNAHTRNST
jgi:hypothetical protein